MTNISYRILERRQKMHIKAYAVLCIILALTAGFYTYQKWQEYHFARVGLSANNAYIAELTQEAAAEKASHEQQKAGFDSASKQLNDKLAVIFPANDNYTELTKQIDIFEQELASKNDPFEVSNIDFQGKVENELFSILPMRMNIRSSSKNFTKFLHWVENSGSLNDEVRLMDINSIRLNFEEGDEAGDEIINFSVQINAYFQK